MKQILLTAAIFVASIGTIQAQTVDKVIKQFKNEKNVNIVNLPKSLIQIGYEADNIQITKDVAKYIDRIQILNLEKVTPATKDKFQKTVEGLKTEGYEDFIKTNEGKEKVHILIKTTNNIIKSLLIIAIEKEECNLVAIDGSITPEEFKKIMD